VHQSRRIVDRSAKADRVDQREEGVVHADAERQRHHGDEGEPAMLRKEAGGEADILRQRQRRPLSFTLQFVSM
jgi:hypothetical protein